MKTNKLMSVLVLPLVLVSTVASAEIKLGDYDLAASIGVGAQLSSGGERQSAKFVEYRDLRNSFLGKADLTAETGAYHIGFSGNRIGLKDQSYSLQGGHYDTFNYNLFYDFMIHNYSFGAKTFMSGVGTNTLTFEGTGNNTVRNNLSPPAPVLNAAAWPNTFDYSIQTKTFGADVNYSSDSPYFLGLGYSRASTSGLRPLGAHSGVPQDLTNSGGTNGTTQVSSAMTGFVELPEPVDYTNNSYSGNVGYKGNDWSVSADAYLSKFSNANDTLTYRDPNVVSRVLNQTFVLPADNTYVKLGLQGSHGNMPLDSVLSWRVAYSKLTDTVTLIDRVWTWNNVPVNGTPTYEELALGLNSPTFEGDIQYGSANVSYASNPFEKFDTRVYYNFLRKWNKSTAIEHTAPGAESVNNHLFHYYKHNAGIEADYRLPFSTKLGVGYDFLNMHRERHDAPSNTDHLFFAQVKNSALDFADIKVRYQRLNRDADTTHLDEEAGTDPLNPAFVNKIVRFFDVGDKNQDAVKVGLDMSPIEHFEVGAEYAYKINTYWPDDAAFLGRTKDWTSEVTADLSYELPRLATFSAFGSYDVSHIQSAHRVQGSGAGVSYDPASPVSTTSTYNWFSDIKHTTWTVGGGVAVPVIESVDFSVGVQRDFGKGRVDFNSLSPAGQPRNFDRYDDYFRNSLTAKTRYRITENLNALFGYLYEKFEYSDPTFDNYQNVVISGRGTNSQPSTTQLLTGAYNDKLYTAHTGYIMAEYRF